MERLGSFFPKGHGRPSGYDCRVLSGIILVNRNGLRWRDAPGRTVHTRSCTTAGNAEAPWGIRPDDGRSGETVRWYEARLFPMPQRVWYLFNGLSSGTGRAGYFNKRIGLGFV